METFGAMFSIVLLFAALLLPGFILGKAKLLEEKAMSSFGNILMYVAMPFLVFGKLTEIDFQTIAWGEVAFSAVLPILLIFALAVCTGYICKGEKAKRRAAIFCATFPNCGFLGIPIAVAMWPNQPQIVLYISIFNVVSTFLLLTVGVYILSGDKKEIRFAKTLCSPIFFAIVLGGAASLLRLSQKFPSIFTYAELLAQLTTPLAMLALGYELSKMHFSTLLCNVNAYVVSAVKLILSPLLAFGLLWLAKFAFGWQIGEPLAFAMMTATAVSTAASAPVMAKKYGADSTDAAAMTVLSTLFGLLTLPLVYTLFYTVF